MEPFATHGISAHEMEKVCFGQPLVLRGKTEGENPLNCVLGQSPAGSHLFCVVIQSPDGTGYPVTARPMTKNEIRRFSQAKNR